MERKRKTVQVSAVSDNGSRREFVTKAGAAAFSISSGLAFDVLTPLPANAVGGLEKVNSRLKAYGLPLVQKPPNGLNPLLEIYGKGKNRFPLLVLMNHPITWVVTVPSNDSNGEDGTIQAGEYAKGDTATFFVYEEPGHVDLTVKFQNIANAGKELYEKALIKYTLLTGAGFEVDRRGVASITSEGPAVEVLWTASTRERFKKTESTLRDIASSFRVYADGLNFSDELKQYDA
eukprot:scaffold3103_cov136-Cylindrotheca_fusiformis.AAC.38